MMQRPATDQVRGIRWAVEIADLAQRLGEMALMLEAVAHAMYRRHECPHCGEDDIDRLVWIDHDKVHCANCGTIYDPDHPEAKQ